MSDEVIRKTFPGNKYNFNRDAVVELQEGGYVRIQRDGNPVDVVLLTPRQLRMIVALAARERP